MTRPVQSRMLALLGFDLKNPSATWVFTTIARADGCRLLEVVGPKTCDRSETLRNITVSNVENEPQSARFTLEQQPLRRRATHSSSASDRVIRLVV